MRALRIDIVLLQLVFVIPKLQIFSFKAFYLIRTPSPLLACVPSWAFFSSKY